MSTTPTPAAAAAQSAPSGAATSGTATASTPAPAPAVAQAGTPAPSQQAQRSSTPRLLRLARVAATAAALLTGVVATGTFDTSGVNATPNVVAAQWVAAEQARVAAAEADLNAARAITSAVVHGDAEIDLMPAAGAAANAHQRTGATDADAGLRAERLVTSSLLVSDALRIAENEPQIAKDSYEVASTLTRQTADATATVAEERATALQTGSRSGLTATVGLLSTLLLGGILVWLALRTRRMLNLPLLLATAITTWLTYVSLNPAALPLNIDQRVDAATTVATALQEVRQARQAEYATVLDLPGTDLDEASAMADEAVAALKNTEVSTTWQEVVAGHEAVQTAETDEAGLAAIRATQEQYDAVDARLSELLDERLEPATDSIGTPAAITSGVALLLGLVAAFAAWSGLTRRLEDYR